jgi:hypothetical protein
MRWRPPALASSLAKIVRMVGAKFRRDGVLQVGDRPQLFLREGYTTSGGSSGSPVFEEDRHHLVGLHYATGRRIDSGGLSLLPHP